MRQGKIRAEGVMESGTDVKVALGDAPATGARRNKEIYISELPPHVQEMLHVYDTDGDGKISLGELEAFASKEKVMEDKFHLYRILFISVFVLLAINLATTFGVVYGVVNYTKDAKVSSASGGAVWTTKNGGLTVQTANSDFYISPDGSFISRTDPNPTTPTPVATIGATTTLALSSNLQDAVYAQLQSISLASPTGATITHNVVGFVRSPPPAGRPNAMGDVTLITPLGTIRISGSNLFYTDDSIYNGIYGQFGFTTPASTGRRSLLQVGTTGSGTFTSTTAVVAATPSASTGVTTNAVTLTVTTKQIATTSRTVGINVGNRHPDDPSWTAYLRRLGSTGARVFGAGGTGLALSCTKTVTVCLAGSGCSSSSPPSALNVTVTSSTVLWTQNNTASSLVFYDTNGNSASFSKKTDQKCSSSTSASSNTLPMFVAYGDVNVAPSSVTMPLSTSSTPSQTTALWGNDMSNKPVTNQAQFNAAVATLRTPAGHDPSKASTFARPPLWALYDTSMNTGAIGGTVDVSGTVTNTVAQLIANGIEPLLVMQLGCSTFSFTTFDWANATYWGERWELYKHQYIMARWAYVRGITRFEVYNEPDLYSNALCIGGNGITSGLSAIPPGLPYLEHITLRGKALNEAYADLNADVANKALACPALPGYSCPLAPNTHTMVSAHSNYPTGSMPAGYTAVPGALGFYNGNGATSATYPLFGNDTIALEHLQWPVNYNVGGTIQSVPPPQNNPVYNPAYSNFASYSFHAYGKSGGGLAGFASYLNQSIVSIRATTGGAAGPIPVVGTEYNTFTGSDWDSRNDNADYAWTGARVASETLQLHGLGFSGYIFKMSAMASSSGGVAKNGITWGEQNTYPYATCDGTYSTEAAGLVVRKIAGGKPAFLVSNSAGYYTPSAGCAAAGNLFCNPTYTAAFGSDDQGLPAVAFQDSVNRYLYVINDVAGSSGKNIYTQGTVALTIDLSAWSVPAGTLVVVSEVSDSYYGEVSAALTVGAGGIITYSAIPFAVLRFTVPVGPQSVLTIGSSDDTTLIADVTTAAAKAAQGAAGGATTMSVGASSSGDHSKTLVSILKFPLPTGAGTTVPLSSVVLTLTLASTFSAAFNSTLTLFGISNSGWSQSTLTWANAGNASVTPVTPGSPFASCNDNFVQMGLGNELAGGMFIPAGAAAGSTRSVDVTEYVNKAASKGQTAVTLLLTRRFRRGLMTGNSGGFVYPNGTVLPKAIPADDLSGGNAAVFYTKEASAGAPSLTFFSAGALTAPSG